MFKTKCCMGIDEAGRGPVLGPMVYSAVVCPKSRLQDLKHMGCNDSKQLTPETRGQMLVSIRSEEFLRDYTEILTAKYLSEMMMRKSKVSLNKISHDAAIELVRRAMEDGVNVDELYVDTVGDPDQYRSKFVAAFPSISTVVVAKKADATYPIVGAASIVAKTCRDYDLRSWINSDTCAKSSSSRVLGSGYPADPATKVWLRQNLHPFFGFPNIVRFSWATTRTLLKSEGVELDWGSDSDDQSDTEGEFTGSINQARTHGMPTITTRRITEFLQCRAHDASSATKSIAKMRKQISFFSRRSLSSVKSLKQ